MRGWGLAEPGELDRVVIVSPHLDDAVLSCGRFMAVHPGVTVVTVFAGNPPAYPEPMRLWDVQSGFGPGDDVMEARRGEDRAALGLLDATPMHLDYIEHTYNPGDRPVAPDVIAAGSLPRSRRSPRRSCSRRSASPIPTTTSRTAPACSCATRSARGRLVELRRQRLQAHPGDARVACVDAVPPEVVADAGVPARRSSRRTQGGRGRVLPVAVAGPGRRLADLAKLEAPAPEQYWRLAPPPPGWEGIIEPS